MSLYTELEAWKAAVRYANQCGLRGDVVESIDVLPPATATQTYQLLVGQIRKPTMNDIY